MVNLEKNLNVNNFLIEDKNEILDLVFLWRLIQNKRWFIFTVTGIVFALSTLYSFRLITVYTANAKVLVERIDQSAFQNPEIIKPQTEWGTAYYLTRAELLKGRQILFLAAEKLNLAEHYNVKTNQQAAAILAGRVETKILKGTQIIELSVTDPDPEWAANITNAISENYLKESWRDRLFISEQLLKWFPQEGEILQQNTPLNQLKKLDKKDAIGSLPSISRDPVINSIKQEQLAVDAQIKEFSGRYTAEHPKMKELVSRTEYLESEMKAQTTKILDGLKSGLVGEFGVSNVKIVEKAAIPYQPSGPKRLRIVMLPTFLSFLGSILFLALLSHLDQTINDEEGLRKVPLPFLGYLPVITGLNRNSKNSTLSFIFSDAKLNNDIANIRLSTLFSMPAERSKLLMCTSAIPEEGKTTIASMLGVAFAEAGEKVMIIDADMRKPSLHSVFGLENKHGLTNYLVGSSELNDIVLPIDGIPGLSVITAGENTPNPMILLSSIRIDQLINELEVLYDKIIFDVPPSLHIPDGLVLAGKVHGIILVFNAGRIHQTIAKKMKEKIMLANGVLLGGVINRAIYKNLSYPYYQHYEKYSKYYHKSDRGNSDSILSKVTSNN